MKLCQQWNVIIYNDSKLLQIPILENKFTYQHTL